MLLHARRALAFLSTPSLSTLSLSTPSLSTLSLSTLSLSTPSLSSLPTRRRFHSRLLLAGVVGAGVFTLLHNKDDNTWQRAWAASDDDEPAWSALRQLDADFDAHSGRDTFVGRLPHWLAAVDALLATPTAGDAARGSLLARRARLLYKQAVETAPGGSDERRQLVYAAHACAKEALALNGDDWFVHKWFAITITEIGDYEGVKQKLLNAFLIRDHLQRSLDLNPADPTTHHALGIWFFTFADMSWITRNVAAALFASPPTGTYQQALDCFLRAEQLSPGFYLKNNLYLVKTYLAIGQPAQAAVWKARAMQMPVANEDDRAAFNELQKITISQ